jgi:LAO/AO transport system kinase
LLDALAAGDRRALARAITLIESTHGDDRRSARELVAAARGRSIRSMRIGVSGPPGAGKSTLIEALGLAAIAAGHRVAVLAVDPTSSITGGAILGDKTRMERLSVHESAFVRPSATRGELGGVARDTGEVLLLCEAAGFDVVFIETVGIGQSESAVVPMTDVFVLLQLPHAGDDLQAIKRGALELADVLVVNKADIDQGAAQRAAWQLRAAGSGTAAVHTVSALHSTGVEDLWRAIEDLAVPRRDSARQDPAIGLPSSSRPFRILGLQQVAIGSADKSRLRHLWVDLLGINLKGSFTSERENVDEYICAVGSGLAEVEIDLMQPVAPEGKPAVHEPPLNHIGLWVDDLPRAVEWLHAKGVRMAPGGIRRGASGHDICFIHPKAGDGFPFGGEGVLIELVQAPAEMRG